MDSLTLQEVFDNALFGIRKQNYEPSLKDGKESMCSYRGDGGSKCAIGHSIPNRVYHESIEGMPIHDLLDSNSKIRDLFRGIFWKPLKDLQLIHDDLTISSRKKDHFEFNMEEFAIRYDLKFTPLKPENNDG